ncbi:unnamed protein product [Schistosoma turkestanicum]|nr:unnamed protein product [Schistosoma turkestanicum]
MINTPQKSGSASKPPTEPSKQATNKRYAIEEANDLTELVLKYQDVWKGKSQFSALMQKHLWMQFSQYLHSRGWPRRNWTQLRRKGQHILRKLDKTTNNKHATSENDPSNRTTVSTSNANRHMNEQNDSVVTNQSNMIRPKLPTLTPSPVVNTTPKPPTLSLSPPTNHVQPSLLHATGPKILNAFSTAHVPQHFAISQDSGVPQSTTNNMVSEMTFNRVAILTPVSCVTFGVANTPTTAVSLPPEVNVSRSSSDQPIGVPLTTTIDLSVSSEDEESHPELSETRDQVNTNHVEDSGQKSKDSIMSVCEKNVAAELLFRKQLKCLDLKIEILQMKKQYWSEKLNLLSKG